MIHKSSLISSRNKHLLIQKMSKPTDVSLNPSFSEKHCSQLAELSAEIFRETGALQQIVPGERTHQEIARLVSRINGYYSNLIAGIRTPPLEVESAISEAFGERPRDANSQTSLVAHIETERLMRENLESADADFSAHSPDFIRWLHAEFYNHLPDSQRLTKTPSGRDSPVEPGAFRDQDITIGRHQPPPPREVPTILAEFDRYFSDENWLATDRLLVVAAAHHRLAWVHPFLDGNGRVARLYSHACLIQAKVDGGGLWSLSRGLARHRQHYFDALAGADLLEPFEKRKRLSGNGLGEFSHFFLETLLDQVKFMKELLQMPAITSRMEKYIYYELAPKKHGEALARLLRATFIGGEIARGEVKLITGLRDTAAREVINLAFEHRLIQSSTPKGPLALRFPAEVLGAYFPRLYLDLPAE